MIKRRTDFSRCSSANFRTAGRLSTTTRQRNELFLQPHLYARAFRQGAIQNFHHTVCDNSLVFLRRSEEHTSELQSPCNLVCRLLLEKKNTDHATHPFSRARHCAHPLRP